MFHLKENNILFVFFKYRTTTCSSCTIQRQIGVLFSTLTRHYRSQHISINTSPKPSDLTWHCDPSIIGKNLNYIVYLIRLISITYFCADFLESSQLKIIWPSFHPTEDTCAVRTTLGSNHHHHIRQSRLMVWFIMNVYIVLNLTGFSLLTANSHSLDDFICMTPGKGPGTVYSLQQFVYVFFKLPNATPAVATNWISTIILLHYCRDLPLLNVKQIVETFETKNRKFVPQHLKPTANILSGFASTSIKIQSHIQ